MGTGRKRKNPGVGVDFKKAKYKVGKKLKAAQNATDTTVKSRAIHLPGQSLAADREGQATSKRNLTLKELLSQVGHYSAKVRRDALTGLMELLEGHPEELTRHAVKVLEIVGGRIVDVDAAVRSTLLKLLSKQVLPILAKTLPPFVPLLMAHVCSAMTHLDVGIRNDALNFLNKLMEYEAGVIGGAYLEPCLNHFGDLLGSQQHSRHLEGQSTATILKVLNGFNAFMEGVNGSSSVGEGGRKLQSGKQSQLLGCRVGWLVNEPAEKDDLNISRLSTNESEPFEGSSREELHKVKEKVLDRLIDMLISACVNLNEGQTQSFQMMLAALKAVVHITLSLESQKAAGSGKVSEGLKRKLSKVVVNQVCPRFPAALPDIEQSQTTKQEIRMFNLCISQLLSRCALWNVTENFQRMLDQLLDFYTRIFSNAETAQATKHAGSKVNEGSDVVPILPDVFQLLPVLDSQSRDGLLQAAGKCAQNLNSKSPAKLACLEFLLDVFRGTTDRKRRLFPGLKHDLLVAWLEILLKIMWEAGTKQQEITQVCLRILHHAGRTGNEATLKCLENMQRELMLMFMIIRKPTKGSSSGKGTFAVCGPLAKLPLSIQSLAISVLHYTPALSPLLLKTILAASLSHPFPLEASIQLLSMVSHKSGMGDVPLTSLKPLIVGLVCGTCDWELPGSDSAAVDWHRATVLISAACDLMWNLGTPTKAITILSQDLVNSLHYLFNGVDGVSSDGPPVREAYGFLMFILYVLRYDPECLQNADGSLDAAKTLLMQSIMVYSLGISDTDVEDAGQVPDSFHPGLQPVLDLIAIHRPILAQLLPCLTERLPKVPINDMEYRTLPQEDVRGLCGMCRVLFGVCSDENVRSTVVECKEGVLELVCGVRDLLAVVGLATKLESECHSMGRKLSVACNHALGVTMND